MHSIQFHIASCLINFIYFSAKKSTLKRGPRPGPDPDFTVFASRGIQELPLFISAALPYTLHWSPA